jgi:3-carboxy-cis,cis-muconate cycloisomerase
MWWKLHVKAVAEQKHLKDVISELDELKIFLSLRISEIFKPESYLGNIQDQIDAVL